LLRALEAVVSKEAVMEEGRGSTFITASIGVVSKGKPQLRPKCPECGGVGLVAASLEYSKVKCDSCGYVFEWVKPDNVKLEE